METILLCLLSAGFFISGGLCRGIFECVTIMKTMAKWWVKQIWITTESGEKKQFYYWSYDLFIYNKDRNGDGKATWWEKTFPNDGGHRIKVLELFCYGLGATFLFISGLHVTISIVALPLFIWWLISFGFDITFDKFRNKP